MELLAYLSISLFMSIIMYAEGVYSIAFEFDSTLLPRRGPVTPAACKRLNKIKWMKDLAVICKQIQSMDIALLNPDGLESTFCRSKALGPLNNRRDIKRDLYKSFARNFERMKRSTILVQDLDMKLHTPDGHISLTEYVHIDERGKKLNGRALHITDEFFDLPDPTMLDILLRAVFQAVTEFTAESFWIARRKDNAGNFQVHVYDPKKPFDSRVYELITATEAQRQGYDRILSEPTGVQLSYLNPNVYSFFAHCLDVMTGKEMPPGQRRRVNIKIK